MPNHYPCPITCRLRLLMQGLASIGQEEKKFEHTSKLTPEEQQEAKQDPIDRVYPRGDQRPQPTHPDPQDAVHLNTTDSSHNMSSVAEPPPAEHEPSPSPDAADPLLRFESLIQPGTEQGGENETVPANQSAGDDTQAGGAGRCDFHN